MFNISQRYDNSVILGNLNCDILYPDKGSKEGRVLLDFIEHKLTNLIKEPTRVTALPGTLFDVTLTNRPRSFLTSGTLDVGLNDHYLAYAVSRSHCPRTCAVTIEKGTFKNYNPKKFCNDLKRSTANCEHVPFMSPKLLETVRKHNKLKRLTTSLSAS